MDDKLNEALRTAVEAWEEMGKADYDHSEEAAERFEHSFYRFIDVFREWVRGLEPRPNSVEQLMALDTCAEIVKRLPAPLHLNFETEAELIIDGRLRIDEDKYD
jgi:hypothetical protein